MKKLAILKIIVILPIEMYKVQVDQLCEQTRIESGISNNPKNFWK